MSTRHQVILDLPILEVPTAQGERTLVADLYIPESPQPPPLVVYIHGGGWCQGSHYRPPLRPRLFDKGIALAAITYRFSQEAPFPACLEDCLTLIRWLYQNAEKFPVDPNRIALWGISAGGHLASLAAMELSRNGHPLKVTSVVNWCGPSDLSALSDTTHPDPKTTQLVIDLLGGQHPGFQALANAASPFHQAHPQTPPHLIVHGDQDDTVPVQQAHQLHQRLQELKVPSQLLICPGSGHLLGEPQEAHVTEKFLLKSFGAS